MLRLLKKRIYTFFVKNVICGGNTVKYMRHLGAKIGENCQISGTATGAGSEAWLIEIGNNVTLASGTILITHDGSSRLFRKHIAQSSRYGNRFGTIIIRDNCFIGANCTILPEVTIGPNSIVGAGSLVNKDVPEGMVYAGVPAKPICTLDQYIESYKEKMIPISAATREELRHELTEHFWGERR